MGGVLSLLYRFFFLLVTIFLCCIIFYVVFFSLSYFILFHTCFNVADGDIPIERRFYGMASYDPFTKKIHLTKPLSSSESHLSRLLSHGQTIFIFFISTCCFFYNVLYPLVCTYVSVLYPCCYYGGVFILLSSACGAAAGWRGLFVFLYVSPLFPLPVCVSFCMLSSS